MKHLFAAVLTVFMLKANGQENKNAAIGHWWFCSEYNRYAEYVITDTVSTIMDISIGVFSPRTIKAFIEVDNIEDAPKSYDTLYYQEVSTQQIRVNWFNDNPVTLYRLNEKVLTAFDYLEQYELNWRQFSAVVEARFYERYARKQLYCPPELIFYSERPILDNASILSEEVEQEIVEIIDSKPVWLVDNQMQILHTDVTGSEPSEMVEIRYSRDSSEAIIVFDKTVNFFGYWQFINPDVSSNGNLDFKMTDLETNRYKPCRMRFFLWVSLRDFIPRTIFINGKALVSSQK